MLVKKLVCVLSQKKPLGTISVNRKMWSLTVSRGVPHYKEELKVAGIHM